MQSVRSPVCQQSASVPLRPHNKALPHFALSSTHIPCPHAPSCPRQCTSLHSDFATGIKNRFLSVCRLFRLLIMQNYILILGLMQIVSNVCLTWSHDYYNFWTKTINCDFGVRPTEHIMDSLKTGAAVPSAGRNEALHFSLKANLILFLYCLLDNSIQSAQN